MSHRRLSLSRLPALLAPFLLLSCSGPEPEFAQSGVTQDASCIESYFNAALQALPFPAAVAACTHGRPPDLTGAAYYQLLASTDHIEYVSHDPAQLTIGIAGSRIPYPANRPAPPELTLAP